MESGNMTIEHPMNMSYSGIPGWAIIALIWGISLFFFFKQVNLATSLIRLGKSEDRSDNMGARIKEWAIVWLGQKKVLRDRVVGTMHVMMFWGFLMIGSDVFDLSSGGRFEALVYWFSDTIFGSDIIGDLWNAMVEIGYSSAFIGASAALFRRVVIKPEKLQHESSVEGNVILLTILTICSTAFIVEAGEGPSSTWEPIGFMVEGWFGTSAIFPSIVVASYWIHMLCLAGFLMAIPASKHMHLVMAFPNVIFHDRKGMAVMKPMATTENGTAVLLDDLDLESFGTLNYVDHSWRQLIDGWACTHCARCQDVCPAYVSGKPLNPMQIVNDTREYALEHQTILLAGDVPEETMIARFNPDAIWACTTCHACVDVCPVYIEHVPKITDTRRHLMMEAMEYPEELNVALGNLEVNSNPYGFGPHERGDWAEGLDVKVGEAAEYLYFVGCAASFDERNKKVARSTIQLLQEGGLDVSILGMDEGCSGDPARRMGNEYLFQMMAEMNVMSFQEMGIKKIVASCPHCFHTLGKEYKDFGGDELEVVHHSQIIAELQSSGNLPTMNKSGNDSLGKVTFHDPCYLGRIGGETEAPRSVIGGVDVEVERSGQDSFCCGAGGAQMWMEEDVDKRVSNIRAKELAATGCDTVAVGCPFCSTMITDGLKDIGSEGIEVLDLAEILWKQIKENDNALKAAKKAASEVSQETASAEV
ncbi:MAG: (Fe-S)-binding protein [Euryarchaeota archaeon]|nr:(Fe-S)-binding protein [Euryarchaeota archaeon]